MSLLLFVLATYHAPAVICGCDTGRGKCPALTQHYHDNDGMCHWDSDDHIVKILPKVNN
jgi:hypothetical protein